MLNSGTLAFTGFVFWVVAARLYPTEAVGLASAAVSTMTLLALFSSLGLGYGLIRFLPSSGDEAKNMINSCFTISGALSIALACIFLGGVKLWSPALLPIREHPVFLTVFVVSTIATTFNTFTNRTFIGKRRANFALGQGLIFSLLRFVPLVILASFFQTFGIFASWGIAISLAVMIGILLFLPNVQTGYYPFPTVSKKIVGDIMPFSFANYTTDIFSAVTIYGLPLLVLNILGAEQNAYFYISWATSSILLMIPTSTSFSLFAEGSHSEGQLRQKIIKGLGFIAVILIPALVIVLLLGDRILLFFGRAYCENAARLLRTLALSALPFSINQVYFTAKRIERNMRNVVLLNGFVAIVTIALSYVLLSSIGIIGAGIGWLGSQSIVAMVVILILFRRPQSSQSEAP